MNLYGPLRIALFIYESFRFMIIIGSFVVFWPLQNISAGGAFAEGSFPYLIYVVPHALFPLMTYFVWIRFSLYQSYVALYIAGKTITLVSIAGWCIFSLKSSILSSTTMGGIPVVGGALLLAMTDAFSIFGGLVLQSKLNRLGTQDPKNGGIGCV